MAFTYDIPEKFAEIPLSRSETIIKNTLDGIKYDGPILSRLEYLLSVLNEEIISGSASGTAIKYKGSKANIAALPTVSETPEGYMYTLISGGTTTSDFVEGSGHTIPDGENVAAVNIGTEESPVMKWDILGGIIDGLQPLITASNKLSADLVDDSNSTNKFVTTLEKRVWDGKQNAIDSSHKLSSSLVDDTAATNKFVTETEKQTWNTKLDDKTTHTTINGIDVYVSNTQPTGDIAVGSVGIGW